MVGGVSCSFFALFFSRGLYEIKGCWVIYLLIRFFWKKKNVQKEIWWFAIRIIRFKKINRKIYDTLDLQRKKMNYYNFNIGRNSNLYIKAEKFLFFGLKQTMINRRCKRVLTFYQAWKLFFSLWNKYNFLKG